MLLCVFGFFFFKQKTAYEMRISDWSSDVCSSDLSTHVTSKRPVFGLAGGVQRSGSLFIGTAYLSPADRAGGDERRQLILAPRDGDGLFVDRKSTRLNSSH